MEREIYMAIDDYNMKLNDKSNIYIVIYDNKCKGIYTSYVLSTKNHFFNSDRLIIKLIDFIIYPGKDAYVFYDDNGIINEISFDSRRSSEYKFIIDM